jgi:cobalt/nickel transport system permease protein
MFFSIQPTHQHMHIPDGFLSVLVAITFWVLSALMVGIALRKTRQTLGESQVPLMGVLAAAIFAGQMLNFSVAGGSSGHLLGEP